MVELAMSDGKGEIIHLHLLCGDEEQAKLMEKNFRLNAENSVRRSLKCSAKNQNIRKNAGNWSPYVNVHTRKLQEPAYDI